MSSNKGIYRRVVKRLMNRVHKWNVANNIFYPAYVYDRVYIKQNSSKVTPEGIMGIRSIYVNISTKGNKKWPTP